MIIFKWKKNNVSDRNSMMSMMFTISGYTIMVECKLIQESN